MGLRYDSETTSPIYINYHFWSVIHKVYKLIKHIVDCNAE